jgi:hypothetical protein
VAGLKKQSEFCARRFERSLGRRRFGFEKTNPIGRRGRDGEGPNAGILRFEANLVQGAGMILLLSSLWQLKSKKRPGTAAGQGAFLKDGDEWHRQRSWHNITEALL